MTSLGISTPGSARASQISVRGSKKVGLQVAAAGVFENSAVRVCAETMDEEKKCVKLYFTSIASTTGIKKRQIRIHDLLTARGIQVEMIDISSPQNKEQLLFMKENAKAEEGKTPLPPQVFLEDEYLGDYEAFSEAVEGDCLEEFLKMAKPPEEISEGEEEQEKEDEEKIKADEDKTEKDITIEEAAEEDKEKADETDSSEGADRD